MPMPDTIDVYGGACTSFSVEEMLDLVHQHSQTPCCEHWNLIRRVLEIVQHAAHTEYLVIPDHCSVI
jgi:hypothetical protein